MSNQLEKIKELIERRATARMGGGDKAIAKQHDKGKYTARERIAMLLDEGSFEEMEVAHVFKKVSMHWPVMLKFSNAIFLLQVLFRRSQVFSVLVQAELFTLLL